MTEKVKKQPWVPYKTREDFKDLEPIPQDDGPLPICQIAYTEEFKEIFGYFRAILRKDEKSPRALEITQDAIRLNPGNYTAWNYRREILFELKADLDKELEYSRTVGLKNPKNYQIWHHRRLVIERSGNFDQELNYTAESINADSKNYHAWAHRQWAVEVQGLWEQEISFIEENLKKDFRNNSLWNQRYFVVTQNGKVPWSEELREKEIQFAISYIQKSPNNQSPWTYIRGIFKNQNMTHFPNLKENLIEWKKKYFMSPYPSSFLVDYYEQEATTDSIKEAIEVKQTQFFEQRAWSREKRCNNNTYLLKKNA